MGGLASREEEDEVTRAVQNKVPQAERGYMILSSEKRVVTKAPPPENLEPGVWTWCIPTWPVDHQHHQLPLVPLTIVSTLCREPRFQFRIKIVRQLEGYEFDIVPIEGQFPRWEAAVSAVSTSETALSTKVVYTNSDIKDRKPVSTMPLPGKRLGSSFCSGPRQSKSAGSRPSHAMTGSSTAPALSDPAELPGPFAVTFTFDYSTLWEQKALPAREKYRPTVKDDPAPPGGTPPVSS